MYLAIATSLSITASILSIIVAGFTLTLLIIKAKKDKDEIE